MIIFQLITRNCIFKLDKCLEEILDNNLILSRILYQTGILASDIHSANIDKKDRTSYHLKLRKVTRKLFILYSISKCNYNFDDIEYFRSEVKNN